MYITSFTDTHFGVICKLKLLRISNILVKILNQLYLILFGISYAMNVILYHLYITIQTNKQVFPAETLLCIQASTTPKSKTLSQLSRIYSEASPYPPHL